MSTSKHTPGPLQALDGALLCKDVNQYGNFIVADCCRERTPEDNANLERLALAWNCHDELLEALRDLLAVGSFRKNGLKAEEAADRAVAVIAKATGDPVPA